MFSTFPILSLRLARLVDGDLAYDVITLAAGVRESDRGALFDYLVAILADRGLSSSDLSLTVADSIVCAPCRVSELALKLADKAETAMRDALAEARRAA